MLEKEALKEESTLVNNDILINQKNNNGKEDKKILNAIECKNVKNQDIISVSNKNDFTTKDGPEDGYLDFKSIIIKNNKKPSPKNIPRSLSFEKEISNEILEISDKEKNRTGMIKPASHVETSAVAKSLVFSEKILVGKHFSKIHLLLKYSILSDKIKIIKNSFLKA